MALALYALFSVVHWELGTQSVRGQLSYLQDNTPITVHLLKRIFVGFNVVPNIQWWVQEKFEKNANNVWRVLGETSISVENLTLTEC